MGLSTEDGPLREAAIFTRAVENVFRKLIRLLLGKMTLTSLQEMIRVVYIEEAQEKLKREHPGKNVPLTRLALMTGLDTRTLNKLTRDQQGSDAFYKRTRYLKDITPESSILDVWSTKTEFLDTETLKPMVLPIRGELPSFEALVDQVNVSRGITMSSILERLEKSESVRLVDDGQRVELVSSRYLPFSKKGMSEALEVGFVTVGYLVDTLVHNLEKKESGDVPFFQRSDWTTRLSRNRLSEFRQELRRCLSDSEERAIELMSRFEGKNSKPDQVTAGFSVFYFEEDSIDY